jgi:hypothetical protein
MEWTLNTQETITVTLSCISAIFAGTALWMAMRKLGYETTNYKLGKFSARAKYFDDFRKWADELSDTLTEAIHLCDLDPKKIVGESVFDRRHRIMIKLSSMIDRGRWFFPNIGIDRHGSEKEMGYQGYRHEMLDGLVEAYRCLGNLNYNSQELKSDIREKLTLCKRHFVGQVQKILDPNSQREELERILEKPKKLKESAKKDR